jgi:hypothetical protein
LEKRGLIEEYERISPRIWIKARKLGWVTAEPDGTIYVECAFIANGHPIQHKPLKSTGTRVNI